MSYNNTDISEEERELIKIMNEPNTCILSNSASRGGTINTNDTQKAIFPNLPSSVIVELAMNIPPEDRKKIMFLNKHMLSLFSEKQISHTQQECIKRNVHNSMKNLLNIGDFYIRFSFDREYRKDGQVKHSIEFNIDKTRFGIITYRQDIARYLKNKYWLSFDADPDDADSIFWSMGGMFQPVGSLIGYEKYTLQPNAKYKIDTASKKANVMDVILDLINTFNLKILSKSHIDAHFRAGYSNTAICNDLKNVRPELWEKCIEGFNS